MLTVTRRAIGLVFLQYRNETKRALLPNEITSMDTVKALFVRSFPRQLSMEYLDSTIIRIYIHDPARDMFYELEGLSTSSKLPPTMSLFRCLRILCSDFK